MHVFVSYPAEQSALAEAIAYRLRADGHDAFVAKRSLLPGMGFDAPIRQALATTDLLVFLITPRSVREGSYPRSELALAQARWPNASGRVLPVMVEPTPFAEIPPYLRSVSILGQDGELVADVANAVQSIARGQVSSVPSRRRPGALLAAALLAGAGLVAAMQFWLSPGSVEGPGRDRPFPGFPREVSLATGQTRDFEFPATADSAVRVRVETLESTPPGGFFFRVHAVDPVQHEADIPYESRAFHTSFAASYIPQATGMYQLRLIGGGGEGRVRVSVRLPASGRVTQ